MDNYFVNREDTPKDENGEYDFETLTALDLPFFNDQVKQLLDGKHEFNESFEHNKNLLRNTMPSKSTANKKAGYIF